LLENGAILQDRYRIVKLLGQGGMGAVYRAWDLRLRVPVALKEMSPQPGLTQSVLDALRAQFQQEAAVLARLNHPNLVRVTDYFEEEGRTYLVMDFVEGQSLADLIAQQGPQPEGQVTGWATQILDALHYCHYKGVVHRDIKPQNIIIRPDGQAVLVDFGLVKLWDPSDPRTRTAMRGLGTPEYAPPEQYGDSGDHTGPQSDLYSLAATIYHALAGQAPVTATERMAMPERFVPLRRLAPNVSARTESVVMKALALPVMSRWSTAAEMRIALVGTPPPATAPSPTVLTLNAAEPSAASETRPPSRPITGPAPAGATPTSPPIARPVRRRWPVAVGVGAAVLCLVAACISVLVFRPGWFARATPTATVTLEPTAAPPATATPPASTVEVTAQATVGATETAGLTVTILNHSPYTVCYFFASPADVGEWGEDWLGTDQVILPGNELAVSLPAGNYDVLIQDCDYLTLASVTAVSAPTQILVGGEGRLPFRIINQLENGICFVYASPSDADDWGEDQLGAVGTIPSGGGWVLFLDPAVYDFRLEDCDGNVVGEQSGVEVDAELEWTLP